MCFTAVIPKSVTPEKIKMNTELDFKMDFKNMDRLSNIFDDIFQKYAWDPIDVM